MKHAARWTLIFAIFASVTALAVEYFDSSNVMLGNFNEVKCSTGITCSQSAGQLLISSSPTLATALSLTAADTVDSSITLKADNSDDSGDDWKIASVASGNAFTISNDTSGSQVAKVSVSTAGVVTLTGALTLSDAEVLSNPSDDVVRIASNDSGIVFDIYSPDTSNGLATLRLSADASADNGDDWQIVNDAANSNNLLFQNDTSGAQVTKLTLSTAGHLTVVGDIIGDGGDQLFGFLQNQVASTTTTLTAAQCGSTIISDSADVVALPEASTVLGCRYTFVCGTADDFDINPDNADIIGPLNSVAGGTGAAITPSAGDAIRCTDIGSSIILEAIAIDRWAAVGVGNGAWTDVN